MTNEQQQQSSVKGTTSEEASPVARTDAPVEAANAIVHRFLPPEKWEEIMREIEKDEQQERLQRDIRRHPWKRDFLPKCKGLALLPIGGRKIPVDPETGGGLKGWPHRAFTLEELSKPNGWIEALGYRPGPESGHILCVDVDGATAVAWLKDRGLQPEEAGWRTVRGVDRLKVHFRLPIELQDQLPIGKFVLTLKEHGGEGGEKGEQIELFNGSGQCVIAGRHPSGANYVNVGSPETVTNLPQAWFEALREIVGKGTKRTQADGKVLDESYQSGPGAPCPVCGRVKSGACTIWISKEEDGSTRTGVNCFHGQTFAPPKTIDLGSTFKGELLLQRGDEITGTDGKQWAFVREGRSSLRTFSVFLEHRPPNQTCVELMESIDTSQPAAKSLKVQLHQVLNDGLSGSDRSLRLKEIADEVGSPLRDVERLVEEIAAEQEREEETASTLDDLVRLNESAGIDLEELIPPELLEVLGAMRTFANYRLDVLLAVLMTGLSGALPLDSRIELSSAEYFRQPLSLWSLLLMPSGEAKSPLLQRLLERPWREAVDTELAEAYERRLAEWEALREQEGDGAVAAGPRPRKPQTLVTEDVTPQGMETHMEIHEQWSNRSMCIWLDEGKGALKQMVDRDNGTGKETPFGGWLLSRYDGTGARGAKADQTKERNYKSCRLSMVTCCQPDVYRAITGDGDQTGLSARFIVVEQNLVEQAFPTIVDFNAVAKADELHKTLVRCYRELAKSNELKLWLSEEAFELFQLERKAMYDRKRASNSPAERALANKVAGRLGRLAGMFHIIWRLMGSKGRSTLGRGGEVSAENMQRAILFNRLLLDQTLGVRLTSADNSELACLMLKLQRRAWEVKAAMPVNELRKGFSSNKRPKMTEVLQALEDLARQGFGELSEVEHRGKRGWRYVALKPLLDVASRHP